MAAKNSGFFSTYVDFHAFDRKGFDDRLLARHVPIEFVPAFVPFDRVQLVPAHVETTGEVGRLSILNVFGDSHGEIG